MLLFIQKYIKHSVRKKAPNSVNSSKRKHKNQINHGRVLMANSTVCQTKWKSIAESVKIAPGYITKTCLYNLDPLKPHFYIVKLGFTGVYIDEAALTSTHNLCFQQKTDYGYSLEPPHRGGSNEYPQSMFWAETWKISEFFIWKFSFFGGKIFSIFE